MPACTLPRRGRRHRTIDCPPIGDRAAAVILAAGDTALVRCASGPAWIRGIDHRIEAHVVSGCASVLFTVDPRLAAERALGFRRPLLIPRSCTPRSAPRKWCCARRSASATRSASTRPAARSPRTRHGRRWPDSPRRGRRPSSPPRRVRPGARPRHAGPCPPAEPGRRPRRGRAPMPKGARGRRRHRPDQARRRPLIDVSLAGLVPRGRRGPPPPGRRPDPGRTSTPWCSIATQLRLFEA